MITGIKTATHYTPTRTLYTLDGVTPAGETLQVEFDRCEDNDSPRNIPKLWKKAGYTPEVMPDWWSVRVCATDPKGCWERYNPTIKPAETGRRYVHNFSWILPATNENRDRIMAEIIRRANAGIRQEVSKR